MIYIFLAFATLLSAQISSVPTSSSGGGTIYTGDGSKITVTGTVISTTSELCGRSEACTVLAARDMSGAGQMIIPRGSGAPPSTGCDAAGEVGNQYIDSTASGSTSGHYVCTASGGTPAWVQLPRAGGGQSLTTPNQGNMVIGTTPSESGTGVGAYTPGKLYCVEQSNPYATLNIRNIWANLAATDTGNFAAIGIYDSAGNLLATSSTLNQNVTGPRAFAFAPFSLTFPSFIVCFGKSGGTTANWFGQMGLSVFRGLMGGMGTRRWFESTNSTTGTSTMVMPGTLGPRLSFTGDIPGMILEP